MELAAARVETAGPWYADASCAEHARKPASYAEGHSIREALRAPTGCVPRGNHCSHSWSLGGRTFLPRISLSRIGAAMGSGMGNLPNSFTLCRHAHASI